MCIMRASCKGQHTDGVLAQLVERFNGIEEVVSSILIGSTIFFYKSPAKPNKQRLRGLFHAQQRAHLVRKAPPLNAPC